MAVDWESMSDAEVQEELDAGNEELVKRANLQSIPQTMDDLNKQYLDSEGTVEGEAWRQPQGAHDAYPLGWIATHNGKTWQSLVAGNVWEPGVSAWQEQVEEGQVPAWVQPTGAHDAYDQGAQVHHNDRIWESNVAANTWEPPTQWTDIGPYPPA